MPRRPVLDRRSRCFEGELPKARHPIESPILRGSCATSFTQAFETKRATRKARQIRPRAEQETGGTMQSVERFDVLFLDVRHG
jgi:hypothetical protein